MDKVVHRKPFEAYEKPKRMPKGDSLTQQSSKDSCDINSILKRYRKTGVISHFRADGGSYEDMPPSMDFHEAVNLVMEAQAGFDALPATVRSEFGNDPAKFLDFLKDPDNRPRAIELGLIDAPADPPVVDPPSVDPPPADPPVAGDSSS